MRAIRSPLDDVVDRLNARPERFPLWRISRALHSCYETRNAEGVREIRDAFVRLVRWQTAGNLSHHAQSMLAQVDLYFMAGMADEHLRSGKHPKDFSAHATRMTDSYPKSFGPVSDFYQESAGFKFTPRKSLAGLVLAIGGVPVDFSDPQYEN